MNDILDPTLKAQGLSGARLAADGSGAGTPRDDEPERNGIELGDMFEMGLESLLMHFRRKPAGPVFTASRPGAEENPGDSTTDSRPEDSQEV